MADTQNGKVMYAKKNELKKIRDSFGLVFQNFQSFSTLFSLEKCY